MAKDVHYFKHDADAHTDLMIKAMLKKYGWQGYGWWWYIVEKLRSQDRYQLEYTEVYFDSIAEDLKSETDEVKSFIDSLVTYKLLKLTDQDDSTYFYSPRLSKDMSHYDDVRQQRQAAGQSSGLSRSAKAKPAATSGILDPTLIAAIKCYEDNIGQATAHVLVELQQLCDDGYPDGWIEDAIKEATNQNKRSLAYFKAILKRWQVDGKGSGKKPVSHERIQKYTLLE